MLSNFLGSNNKDERQKKEIVFAIVTVSLVLLSAYQFNCMLQIYCTSNYI